MRLFSACFAGVCLVSSFLGGCSGADGTMGIPGGGSSGTGSSGTHGSGPQVHVHVVAEQTPVQDTDGTARETPSDQRMGILGLELLRNETDPSPVVVFQNKTPVDTGYNAGDDTVVGNAPVSMLLAGTYTFARVPVAYVKFTVAGSYHYAGLSAAGQFSDSIALSDQTMLEGAQRDQGWWTSSFLLGGKSYTSSGEGAAFAQPGPTSGIHLDMTEATGAYLVPLNLTIDPKSLDHDVALTFTFNTYADFHWQDEAGAGYATGVFDVTYGSFEPVTQLGANSVTVTLQ